MHIIKTKSEVDFIKNLEAYLENKNNGFQKYDWWFFSKIDEILDEVYIPYYQPKSNRIEKYKPDFIFWFKKGNVYTIVFVDPKGTEFTNGYRKIDGYSKIFEVETNHSKVSKTFLYNDFSIKTKLLLQTSKGMQTILENYKKYWFSNPSEVYKIIES